MPNQKREMLITLAWMAGARALALPAVWFCVVPGGQG